MPAPTILDPSQYFFNVSYEGNGGGQRIGKFVPYTDNGTIAKSCIFNRGDSANLIRTVTSTSNRRTFTVSLWFKIGITSTGGSGVGNFMWATDGVSGSEQCYLFLGNDDTLGFQMLNSAGSNILTQMCNRTVEDSGSWHHVVAAIDTTQSTNTDKLKLYLDGDLQSSFSSSNYDIGTNGDCPVNQENVKMSIGEDTISNQHFDGYIAEVNFIDGTAYGPETFGITDTSTGRWVPKSLGSITYGTNGVRLTFANSAGQTIGDDTSGNGNDLTVNNLVASDIVTDSPTQNHMTFDQNRDGGQTLSEGNLKLTINASHKHVMGSMVLPKSGKFYWETTVTTTVNKYRSIGIAPETHSLTDTSGQTDVRVIQVVSTDGTRDGRPISWNNGEQNLGTSIGTMSNGTVVSWALDADNEKLYISIGDDNWKGFDTNASDPAAGTNATFNNVYKTVNWRPIATSYNNSTAHVFDWNFGQRSFTNTVPTGFVALQQDNYPVTGIDFDNPVPDMVWAKSRDNTESHVIYDSTRGVQKMISPNNNTAEGTQSDGLQKFLAGGFASEDHERMNQSAISYAAWNWVAAGGTTAANTDGSGANVASVTQANQTAGFSIVTFTASNDSGFNTDKVAHGLSQAPEWFFFKRLDSTSDWIVYHTSAYSSNQHALVLNSSAAEATFNTELNPSMFPARPTSSVFSYVSGSAVTKGSNQVAYCWHSVPGFSKIGSYVGSGTETYIGGPRILLDFTPAWVLIKRIDANQGWLLFDNVRNQFNPRKTFINVEANSSESESGGHQVNFLSNGFEIVNSDNNATLNNSGSKHLYIAFADKPFLGDGKNPMTAI